MFANNPLPFPNEFDVDFRHLILSLPLAFEFVHPVNPAVDKGTGRLRCIVPEKGSFGLIILFKDYYEQLQVASSFEKT